MTPSKLSERGSLRRGRKCRNRPVFRSRWFKPAERVPIHNVVRLDRQREHAVVFEAERIRRIVPADADRRGRADAIQATAGRTDPQRSVRRLREARDVVVAQFVGSVVTARHRRKRTDARIPCVDADVRTHPDDAAAILIQRYDVVVAQAVEVGRILAHVFEAVGARVVAIESAAVRADPERTRCVVEQHADAVGAQARGIVRAMAICGVSCAYACRGGPDRLRRYRSRAHRWRRRRCSRFGVGARDSGSR